MLSKQDMVLPKQESAEMKKRCRCDSCLLHRRVNKTVSSGPRKKLVSLVRELEDALANTASDLEHHKSIAGGYWPQGREILERWLSRYPKQELGEMVEGQKSLSAE